MKTYTRLLYLFYVYIGLFTRSSSADVFGGLITTVGDTVDKVLGPASTILGIVSFVMDLIESPNDVGGTIVAIGANDDAAVDEGKSTGNIRVVWAFDVFNNVLGSSNLDTTIPPAVAEAITVHQHMGETSQGQSISILAGDDEICITHVAASMPTGDTWSWTGDIGALCGQTWEHGAVQLGYTKSGDPYFPKCTWMDTNHGKDLEDPVPITNRQMKIDIMAYGTKDGVKSGDYYCGATIFAWEHDDPIARRPVRGVCCEACVVCKQEQAQFQAKRSLWSNSTKPARPRLRSQRSAERLIVNSRPQQSAITLCSSPTSRGSDFASIDEGLFCDMSTKILYPICDKNITDGCFDLNVESPQLRAAGQHVTRALAEAQYKRISHWD